MKKFAAALLKAFEIGEGLSGSKTLISILLIFAGKNLEASADALALAPDIGFLIWAKAALEVGIYWLGQASYLAGGALLPVGLLDKVRKFLVNLVK